MPVSALYIVSTINLVFSISTQDTQHSKSCSKQNQLISINIIERQVCFTERTAMTSIPDIWMTSGRVQRCGLQEAMKKL